MRALLIADPPARDKFQAWLESEGLEVDVRDASRSDVLRPVPKNTDVVLALRLGGRGAAMKEAARRAGARFIPLPAGTSEAEKVLEEAGVLPLPNPVIRRDTAAEKRIAAALQAELIGAAAAVVSPDSVLQQATLKREVEEALEKGAPMYPVRPRTVRPERNGASSELAPEPPAPVVEAAPEPPATPPAAEPPPAPTGPPAPAAPPATPPHRLLGAAERRMAAQTVSGRHEAKKRDVRVMLTRSPHLSVERIQGTLQRRYGSQLNTTIVATIRREVKASLGETGAPRRRAAPEPVAPPAPAPAEVVGRVRREASTPGEGGYTPDQLAAIALMRSAFAGSNAERIVFEQDSAGGYRVSVKRTVVTRTEVEDEL